MGTENERYRFEDTNEGMKSLYINSMILALMAESGLSKSIGGRAFQSLGNLLK